MTALDVERYRDVLNPQFAEYLEHELVATRLCSFQPRVFHGLVQTIEYSLALDTGTGLPGTTDEMRTRQIEVRKARQRLLHDAEIHIVHDEATFLRRVDQDTPNEQIMSAQVEHLRQLHARPNVTIQVLPFSRSLRRGSLGPYTVLDFPGGALVYREGYGQEAIQRDPGQVTEFRDLFDRLSGVAVDLEQYL